MSNLNFHEFVQMKIKRGHYFYIYEICSPVPIGVIGVVRVKNNIQLILDNIFARKNIYPESKRVSAFKKLCAVK